MIIFRRFEHSSLLTSIPNKLKSISHATTFITLIISCDCNISHSLTCPTVKNTKKWSFLISLSTPPYWSRSQSKVKSTGNNIFISCSCKISYPLTCIKTWRKGPSWLKILKNHHHSYVWKLLSADLDHKAK